MNTINGLIMEIWMLLLVMAPYLVFGFAMAGVLKVLIPEEFLVHHLSGKKWSSVFKAAFVGVPLPLCSCGVIPVTAHLKKSGAGRGAVLSFLTSTPTTGIDSILATYSLLGWIFVVIRMIASFFIGIVGGLLANTFIKDEPSSKIVTDVETCEAGCVAHHGKGIFGKIKDMLSYAYIDLIDDVGKWLVIGIVIGGLISYFLPATLIENYFSNPFISYTVMLLIGGSMYVCATGSIPIAASLILKGMNPGAGLVFLIAGPATNAATISFVGGKLGGKTLFIYMLSIVLGAVGFGLLMDLFWPGLGHDIRSAADTMKMLPYWLEFSSAVILVVFISRSYIVKIVNVFYKPTLAEVNIKIKIADMTCEHCKRTIEKVVSEVPGVQKVVVDIKTKIVEIQGNADKEEIFRRIRNAGYSPE